VFDWVGQIGRRLQLCSFQASRSCVQILVKAMRVGVCGVQNRAQHYIGSHSFGTAHEHSASCSHANSNMQGAW
jgi:hypothetical protein